MSSILLVSSATSSTYTAFRQTMHEAGYTLHFAANREEAFQQARHTSPVALILDAARSGGDLSLCQWLRTDPNTIAINLLVTAEDSAARQAALNAGADEVLVHPLDSVETRTRLRTMQVDQTRHPSLEDFLNFTPDLILGANPMDILGNADLLNHDLKSPLGIIVSSLELLREYQQERIKAGDEETVFEARMSDNALLAARRQLNLINDMIDLAKIEVAAYPLTLHPVNLVDLAGQVLQDHQPAIERKQVRVTLQRPEGLPDVQGDGDLIQRICTVLLDSSLKFSSTGDTAEFTFAADERTATLFLRDYGRPILPEYQDAIFERGIQWEARQNGGRSSVAMGLPFARAAARLMHGDLNGYTNPADGATTFYLRLPLALPA